MNNLNDSYKSYLENPCVSTQEVLTRDMLGVGTAWIKQKYRNNYGRYEDIVVDTSLEIWRGLKEGRCKYDATQGMSFKTWYLMDLKANLEDAKRQEQHFVQLSPNLVALEDHWKEAKIDLERLIPTLTEQQKSVIELFLEGYTHEEIGRKMNIGREAVTRLYQRAVASLKEKMNPA